jgi:hypothetical protein
MTGDDLRSIPLFAALGDDDLDWISEAGRELRLATGDRLFAEGRPTSPSSSCSTAASR